MRLSVNARFGLRKSLGDVVADPCPLELVPIKPRIKVICEPRLWRWVSDAVTGVLGSYLESGEGDFSCSSRRRPAQPFAAAYYDSNTRRFTLIPNPVRRNLLPQFLRRHQKAAA